MESSQSKRLHRQIRAYNLIDALKQRLDIIIVEGVANTTIYKAFREGGTTPLLEKILETAQILVEEHEASIKEKLAALVLPVEA